MARRRFYATPDDIRSPVVNLSDGETHHLIHVLRMIPGDQAFVFDGCGREYKCSFRTIVNNRAQLDVLDEISDAVESPLDVTLAQAMTKGEKFDFIVQKATELGVSRISPLATRRAEMKLDDQQVSRRVERWRRISLEALKQCGRRKLVQIEPPRTLREFLDESASPNVAPGTPVLASHSRPALLLFSERGGMPMADAIDGLSKPCPVVALIGPEGGWSDDELELLEQHGSQAVSLGPRVLRTETAALVALSLIQHVIGDLSVRGAQ